MWCSVAERWGLGVGGWRLGAGWKVEVVEGANINAVNMDLVMHYHDS